MLSLLLAAFSTFFASPAFPLGIDSGSIDGTSVSPSTVSASQCVRTDSAGTHFLAGPGCGATEAVFNEASGDVDFRAESNNLTHMLFLDAGNDRVSIGISTPATNLDISGNFQWGSGATKSTGATTGALTLANAAALALSGSGGTILNRSSNTASAFFGDGANLTGIPSTNSIVGVYVLKSGDGMSGPLTMVASTLTVGGNAFSVGGSTFSVAGGSVAVGTTAPATRLEVDGSLSFGAGAAKSTGSATGAFTLASGAALTASGAAGNVIGASSVTTTGGLFSGGLLLTGAAAHATFPASATFNGGIFVPGDLLLSGANSFLTARSSTNASGIFANGLTISGASGFSTFNSSVTAQGIFAKDATLSLLTSGSVLFAGTGGLLSQDNSNLFWDDSANKLGIGDTSPDAVLEVVHNASGLYALRVSSENASTDLFVVKGASVGFNESNPNSALHLSSGAANFVGAGAYVLTTGSTTANRLLSTHGPDAAPAISFVGDPDTGISGDGNAVFLLAGGVQGGVVTTAGVLGGAGAAGAGLLGASVGACTDPAVTFGGDVDAGLCRTAADDIGLATAGTRRLRADPSGNVAIGTGGTVSTFTATTGFMGLVPSTQTISAGNTVAADACGGIKLISAAGAVATDTTNTFTAPSEALRGCVLNVCNSGAFNITLDANILFRSAAGADVVVTTDDCVQVGCDGSYWRQLSALVAN